jgi:hypothetical protein
MVFPEGSLKVRLISRTFSWFVLKPNMTQSTDICGLMFLPGEFIPPNLKNKCMKNKVNVKNTLTTPYFMSRPGSQRLREGM